MTHTSTAMKSKLDTMVGEFFYANNIPFNVAESKYFKDLISELRPGYQPPNSRAIGGALLNEAAKSVDDKLKDELKTASITIVQDGWSNVKRDAIIGTSVHTRGSSYLVDAQEAGAEKKLQSFALKKPVK